MGRLARRARAALAPGSGLRGKARSARSRRVLPLAVAGLVLGAGLAAAGSQVLPRSRPGSPALAAQQQRQQAARRAIPAAPAARLAAGPPQPVGGGPAEARGATRAELRARARAEASLLARDQASGQTFGQIILPDLLIVAPRGLSRQQVARLDAISGVRDLISFDGAQLSVGGRSVSVIGVNPSAFRPWVPVRTASDQALWTALGQGQFLAADTAGQRLALRAGANYKLAGATAQVLRYAGQARLGLNGVDLVVSQSMSVRLGLVHQVAALISAPGVSMARLTSAVTSILGPGGKMESLRSQQLTAPAPRGIAPGSGGSGLPTTYLQLFQESASRYCPGLSWTVLAAIGQIESADGTNVGPSAAGALGPMQFLPSTWATWGIDGFGQTGTPDIMNPYDAVPAAARLLCADGAARGGPALSGAIFDYNHADWYVREVLQLAASYAAEFPDR
jgi:hypothetical protein